MRTTITILSFILTFSLPAFCQSISESKNLLTSENVYFDFGKYDIRPETDSILSKIVELIKKGPGVGRHEIEIVAHTDSIGTLGNNQKLSINRAKAIQSHLLNLAIPDSIITIDALGETKPATTNSTEEGRQSNRRATINVYLLPEPEKPIVKVLIQGIVTDKKTGEPLIADVVIRSKTFQDTITTNESGEFEAWVADSTVVGIDAYATCYFFQSKMVKALAGRTPFQELSLPPIEVGSSIDLQNLFFVGNKAILLKKSEPELPKLLTFMQRNPNMKIEIAGHVNHPIGGKLSTNTWEYRLSVERAKTIHDYLIESGISADRISFQGYGDWEMRFPRPRNPREEEQNRRVEIRAIEGCDPDKID